MRGFGDHVGRGFPPERGRLVLCVMQQSVEDCLGFGWVGFCRRPGLVVGLSRFRIQVLCSKYYALVEATTLSRVFFGPGSKSSEIGTELIGAWPIMR